MMAHPDVKGLRRIMLNTRDAHDLYIKYAGFRPLLKSESWLKRFNELPDARCQTRRSDQAKKYILQAEINKDLAIGDCSWWGDCNRNLVA